MEEMPEKNKPKPEGCMYENQQQVLEPVSETVLSSTYGALLAPLGQLFGVRHYVAEHRSMCINS